MNREQNYLREQVKRLKWQEDISYKYIAEEVLEMKYNSFVNFVNGYKDLGSERVKILRSPILNLMWKLLTQPKMEKILLKLLPIFL